MSSTRQILNRKRAAENISKVTHTMETISAVKYRQHYGAWQQGRDFYDALARLAYLMLIAEHTINHPLLTENKSDTRALIVIASDRGLCGSHNTGIFRLIDTHINLARRFGRKLKVYAKGNRVINYLNGRGVPIAEKYTDFDEIPSPEQARRIGADFSQQYIDGQIGALSVAYTRFFSPASQHPQTLSVFPVAELIDDLTTRATVIWPWELEFEDFIVSPSPEKLFGEIVKMIVNTVLSECFLEAALSEHLERVVAMRSATDNANEMIEDLSMDYNRARQGKITSDLLDIIGGTFG
ncbi:MAG: ATP synthase F1 subunit gamma [Planctomycetes bacterium]|nr:ATP synthase F1 subunit gamma [Planctomycetota bacterium]